MCWKNLFFNTVVWSLVNRVKNLIEKKLAGLSDSDMVSGGLKMLQKRYTRTVLTSGNTVGISVCIEEESTLKGIHICNF